MRARTGLIGSLAVALSVSLVAQTIPPASIVDEEMGWLKVYDFKAATEPLKVDQRVYSPAQRTIAVDLANWMQASYSPIGGLGDVVRTFPRLGPAVPHSYGVVGKIYTQLKYGANRKPEPLTGDSYSWNVMVNGLFGSAAAAINTPERYYFTIPTMAQNGYSEEIQKAADLSGHPFLGQRRVPEGHSRSVAVRCRLIRPAGPGWAERSDVHQQRQDLEGLIHSAPLLYTPIHAAVRQRRRRQRRPHRSPLLLGHRLRNRHRHRVVGVRPHLLVTSLLPQI